MAKVVLKLLKILDAEDSEIIGLIDVPEFSETTVLLDRDHMGKILIKEAESKEDIEWVQKLHKLESMMNVLEGLITRMSAQSQMVYSSIQDVKGDL